MEPYLSGKQLISKEEWQYFLTGVRAMVEETNNLEKSYVDLARTFENAILERAKECSGTIGLFFSGGVDSTLIAHILKKNNVSFIAYTVGFQDEGTKEPEDITESKKSAEHLEFTQKIIMLSLKEAEKTFTITKKLLQETSDPISLGVGSVVVAAAQEAKKDGVTDFFGGLGSEEIFAGYQRHEEAKNIQEECWQGLKNMYERDLIRDCKLASGLGISVHTPFLDDRVITIAMGIPDTEKIKKHEGIEQKKYCLRVIAEQLGLPAQFAWRPKRAAQYGSRTDSALDKLAKKKGITKKEYCTYED